MLMWLGRYLTSVGAAAIILLTSGRPGREVLNCFSIIATGGHGLLTRIRRTLDPH